MDDEQQDVLLRNYNFTLSADINGPLLAAVISIEMIAGLIANSFVLIITICHCSSGTWKKPSTLFLTNMLICNLFTVLLVMPLNIISLASRGWIFGVTVDQKLITCNLAGYIYWNSVLLISLSLMLLSIDRWIYIVQAMRYDSLVTPRRALLAIIITWSLAIVLNVTPFFGFGTYNFLESYAGCSPIWEGHVGYVVYMLIIFVSIVGTIVVTSCWTFCYLFMYIRRRKERSSIGPGRKRSIDQYVAARRKLIVLFGVLLFIHFISYLPGIITAGVVIFVSLPKEVYATSYILFLSITTLSPLAQSCFREDIRSKLCKKKEEPPGTVDSSPFTDN
ncbi:PREDICTED: G-protein coupled receptor 161-like [Amphimedon queenslandica]|uniref:G-protein coupled receptors family 1 profile domain-containing protein n=1 Tax=Amphimedon queenslandica TaxID=400682 RepID=A0A1X7U7Y1_AMPQE|nr:PREDICTED: G-protein coupled receptor 161-like [Amphimedon queenslandica]|eukprot:XP_011405831.1 PREDICTED: G-protein coupled receptor 161-like [Amphimedon queenslandica]